MTVAIKNHRLGAKCPQGPASTCHFRMAEISRNKPCDSAGLQAQRLAHCCTCKRTTPSESPCVSPIGAMRNDSFLIRRSPSTPLRSLRERWSMVTSTTAIGMFAISRPSFANHQSANVCNHMAEYTTFSRTSSESDYCEADALKILERWVVVCRTTSWIGCITLGHHNNHTLPSPREQNPICIF